MFLSAVPRKRRPPPFESSGHSFEVISVKKDTSSASQISYEIKATPVECAFGFPLLGVGFLQVTDLILLRVEQQGHIKDEGHHLHIPALEQYSRLLEKTDVESV